jgi:pyruvate/2-oxoglutarate dehydrogenase complex dihydrolipoamide acyltransferase (E2) component
MLFLVSVTSDVPVPVTIPKATITMEEANIVAWRKQVGDAVSPDEILFEMETDKVIVEVPALVSGILLRIDVAEGVARLDHAIGWIGHAGEAIPGAASQRELKQDASPVAAAALPAPGIPADHSGAAQSGAPAASPAARRRARELGIDIRSVRGTGPGGRITESDVDNRERQA